MGKNIKRDLPNVNLALRQDLLDKAAELTKAIDKDVRWLRYAKPTSQGFRIYANRISQWQVLGEIVNAVAPKYPGLATGQVVDVLCDLVNTKQ